jgi:hypothetical protein
MGLDAAVEHKARPDDRSLKQQAAANGRKPDAELLDHDPSSRWPYSREAAPEPLSPSSRGDDLVNPAAA